MARKYLFKVHPVIIIPNFAPAYRIVNIEFPVQPRYGQPFFKLAPFHRSHVLYCARTLSHHRPYG